jgi:tryptophan halogenase
MKNNYIILGGGTAGLISAMMLKKTYPEKSILIIKSDNVGIIGVGEGSTKEFTQFMNYMGILPYDLIKNAGATFKAGIYFKKWGKNNFLHTRSAFYDQNWLSVKPYYYYHIGYTPEEPLTEAYYHKNEFFMDFLDHPSKSPVNQYHFDTFKLNEYFLNICKSLEIDIIDDTIENFLLNESGCINSLVGAKKIYEADFFIDASGFKRILNKSEWVSYSNKLILNKAVAFQTEKTQEFNAWTLAKKYKGGWRWQIPTQDRTGNGVVFNKYLIDDEIKILIEHGNREFDFYPGRLNKIWNKNVLSVGLSAMFVEPLEATSIGSTIKQMFLFLDMISKKDEENYNKIINIVFDQLVEFIQIHYYGTDIQGEVSLELKEKLKKWKKKLPTDSDVVVPFGLFETGNYIEILHGIDHFEINSIKECFDLLPLHLKQIVIQQINNIKKNNSIVPKIGHKNAIDIIRKVY